MTARCGSIDPMHRSRTCRDCDRIYKQRSATGAPPVMFRQRSNPARCIVCGLAAGNSLNVGVYRYSLKRWSRNKARWIGSVGICDTCQLERGEVKAEFRSVA